MGYPLKKHLYFFFDVRKKLKMISKERNILRRELEMKNKVEIWF